ncbi:MAG: formylglycine-generating enzyme family protein, partial [Planctomycetes bacterium]|nr:formylglycine-generating enzyme family protein [Planctomycetota bacterium]
MKKKLQLWIVVAVAVIAAVVALSVPRNPKLGDSITNSVDMKLAYIPPTDRGGFMMGGDQSPEQVARLGGGNADWYKNEHPQHRVILTKGFWMGRTEVTQRQWKAVMGTTLRQQRDKANPQWPLYGEGPDYPMYYVSWEEAMQFCRKLNAMRGEEGRRYRLPTEAEWEYACRAGTTTPFNTGNTISTDQANYNGNYTYDNGRKGKHRNKTTAAGAFAPNNWGLYDMHGNVCEW